MLLLVIIKPGVAQHEISLSFERPNCFNLIRRSSPTFGRHQTTLIADSDARL